MTRLLLLLVLLAGAAPARAEAPLLRSARSGPWSSPRTWENGQVPGAGATVQIRAGHVVTYDVDSASVIRSIHVAGTLTFARDKNTRLDVGLIKVQPGDHASENGADCDHVHGASGPTPALEVGTAEAPIPAGRTTTIRLAAVTGQDPGTLPAILSCGGRMDFHGAPLSRSWVKLGAQGKVADRQLELSEPVTGWRPGDMVIVTTTAFVNLFTRRPGGGRMIPSILDGTQTEEAHITSIQGTTLTLDKPLAFEHLVEGRYRGEVANLSRNVVVESADPGGVRGHTMYHHGSSGSISYAEFRHLGKKGVLARYPIHFHKLRDTMRGSSVVGASIWDSDNRWVTIHGTDYLVIRDCVGYRSVGHGFFFEDGTEELNVLDRNLAVQAMLADPIPGQALATDLNDGAGFWWANSLNSFTRNVAVECSHHGFRYQLSKTDTSGVEFEVRQDDGSMKRVDVRTLPFLRFEGNEAHSQRRFSLNLGGFNALGDDRDVDRDGNVLDRVKYLTGDVQGVGPDDRHPFVIKDFLAWRSQWGFHAGSPNVHFQGFDAYDVVYVVWRSNQAGHEYNDLKFQKVETSSFFFNYAETRSRYDLLRYLHLDDTQPPVTVITGLRRLASGMIEVSGVAADDVAIKGVQVNGKPATLRPGLVAEWTAVVPVSGSKLAVEARSEDSSGNLELTPHALKASTTDLADPAQVAVVRPGRQIRPEDQESDYDDDAPKMGKAAAVREVTVARAAPLVSPAKWPLWDGKESVARYAERAKLPPTRIVEVGKERLELVLVPAARFVMGSPGDEPYRTPDEGPPRAVLISAPFYLGRTEVTQGQYQAVVGSNPSYFPGSDLPVETVTWDQATAFAAKAGHALRLPTEAEWELAARAGTQTPYFTGVTEADLGRAGWFGYGADDPGKNQSHPVGKKAANAFGLLDMHGNVYEWCADWYAPDTYAGGPAVDPAGPPTGTERVLRGGSWESPPFTSRSANRNGYPPVSHGYSVGFRVAMPVK